MNGSVLAVKYTGSF